MIDLRTGKPLTPPLTRRNALKGLASIIASGVAPSIALGLVGSANASGARGMMRGVGVRTAAICEGCGISARSYIQNGLIMLIDGIENDGYGIHNPLISNVKDNQNLGVSTNISTVGLSVNDSYLRCDHISFNSDVIKDCVNNDSITVQCCFRAVIRWTYTSPFQFAGLRGFGWNGDSSSSYAYFAGTVNWRSKYGSNKIKEPKTDKSFSTATLTIRDGLGAVGYYNDYQSFYFNTNYVASNSNECDVFYFLGSGKMDLGCLRVYNRNLTDEEITANYATDKARFNLT